MNQDNVVLLETDDSTGIATIILNRPKALNALDLALSRSLRRAVCEVEGNSLVRAVVIRSSSAHFMAGGDIPTFHASLSDSAAERKLMIETLISEVHDTVLRLRRMEKPVIASVRGAVAGFGMSLMNSCDLAIAADDAYFTLAYRNIGASPDGGSTYSLPRIVGMKQAMEIALLGDRFDARKALELGLVNRVVSTSELDATTQELALRLAQGPTRALGRTKRLLNESLSQSLTNQLQAEQDSFAACTQDEDFARGIKAFMSKQRPEFVGR